MKNFEDYLPRIRKIIQKISKNEGVVDDLAQECCLRIIEKEHLWKPEKGTMEQWINAITRNLTLMHLQREKKSVSIDEEIVKNPQDSNFSEEHIEWVFSQFRNLPEKQRMILHQRYFEGRKVTEIANDLGVTKSAVSQQIRLALSALKKKAKAQGLLSFLVPWNWFSGNRTSSNDMSYINSVTLAVKIAIALMIVPVLWMGYTLISESEVNSNYSLSTNHTPEHKNEEKSNASVSKITTLPPSVIKKLEKNQFIKKGHISLSAGKVVKQENKQVHLQHTHDPKDGANLTETIKYENGDKRVIGRWKDKCIFSNTLLDNYDLIKQRNTYYSSGNLRSFRFKEGKNYIEEFYYESGELMMLLRFDAWEGWYTSYSKSGEISGYRHRIQYETSKNNALSTIEKYLNADKNVYLIRGLIDNKEVIIYSVKDQIDQRAEFGISTE